MLVRRPVPLPAGVTLPTRLTFMDQAGAPWLIRNKSWEKETDFNAAIYSWQIESGTLPAGTERVYASGGHANPHYFALARTTNFNGAGVWTLYELPPKQGPLWQPVFSGVIEWNGGVRPGAEGWYGPVHVNPYDPSRLFLLTADGVEVSHRDASGKLVFAADAVLTQLITASRSFPLVRETFGGNSLADPATDVLAGARMLGDSTLGLVSFARSAPAVTVVAAPFTGAFFDGGDGIWRSFVNILPRTYAPVWAARTDGQSVYLGFAGRSVGRISNPRAANRATYFERVNGFVPALGGGGVLLARLRVSDGTLALHQSVSVRIVEADGATIYDQPIVGLDTTAQAAVPAAMAHPGVVVHVRFKGNPNADLAPSELHYGY